MIFQNKSLILQDREMSIGKGSLIIENEALPALKASTILEIMFLTLECTIII